MVIVTFKDSRTKLVNFFEASFKTVAEAKREMEADARAYASVHGNIPKWHGNNPKWVNPKNEDYLEVKGTDGINCIWQYCKY